VHVTRVNLWRFILIGLAAGVLSGLFGVGGGIVMVPLLSLVGVLPRLASGTSLAATVPISLVGLITYAAHGALDLIPGLAIGGGTFLGAYVGTWLLQRIRPKALQITFALVMLATAVRLFIALPGDGDPFTPTLGRVLLLVVFGVVVGVLSGLLGIGGGLVIVPVLVLGMGIDATIAKGASLVAILPGGVSGTLGNLRNHNVDLGMATAIGLSGAAGTVLGGWLVQVIDQRVAMALFTGLLVISALQMARKALNSPR
jgi:uncharacterized membrane protein YfcA